LATPDVAVPEALALALAPALAPVLALALAVEPALAALLPDELLLEEQPAITAAAASAAHGASHLLDLCIIAMASITRSTSQA
jgi:hypothetical protein